MTGFKSEAVTWPAVQTCSLCSFYFLRGWKPQRTNLSGCGSTPRRLWKAPILRQFPPGSCAALGDHGGILLGLVHTLSALTLPRALGKPARRPSGPCSIMLFPAVICEPLPGHAPAQPNAIELLCCEDIRGAAFLAGAECKKERES